MCEKSSDPNINDMPSLALAAETEGVNKVVCRYESVRIYEGIVSLLEDMLSIAKVIKICSGL